MSILPPQQPPYFDHYQLDTTTQQLGRAIKTSVETGHAANTNALAAINAAGKLAADLTHIENRLKNMEERYAYLVDLMPEIEDAFRARLELERSTSADTK